MADVRRKGVKNYPRLNNQRIHPDAYRILNRIAGKRCLAAAVEDLCKLYENWEKQKHPRPLAASLQNLS